MTHSNQSHENEDVLLLLCETVMLKHMFRVHWKVCPEKFVSLLSHS